MKHSSKTFSRPYILLAAFGLLVSLLSSTSEAQNCGRASICWTHEPQVTTIPKPPTIWDPSPNFGSRDSLVPVDSIVMHTTEVSLAGTLNIFRNRSNSVSAHFVIAPNGDIYEMVDTRNRAWHATYYNSRSVGIEMVGYAGFASTWNDQNLASLVELLSWLYQAYPEIPLTRPPGNAYSYPNDQFDAPGLVAHGQVQPWNRSDPGPYFPWNDVMTRVAERLASVPEPSSLAISLVGMTFVLGRIRNGRDLNS